MEFFNSMEEKTNKDNIEVLLGNIYWQRKAAEAIAAQRIAEAELEAYKNAESQEGYFPLTENAKQAVNNQTMYSYLKAVDKILADTPDGYVAKQVFSGDDR
ncbi:MAG: hypothetical protein IJE68_03480 [Clostridia bacterium]|nr:hypothetical protein [Clostridia bacterium]